jgi:hypothetical protein
MSGIIGEAGSRSGTLTQSSNYYLELNVASSYQMSSGTMVNTSGTTNPYFTYTGDTTNIIGVNDHDIKLVKAGIYLITFNMTAYIGTTLTSRYVKCAIRGSGSNSESTTSLAIGHDQIADTDASVDYGGTTATLVKAFNANELINFFVEGEDTSSWVSSDSDAHIILIRPT